MFIHNFDPVAIQIFSIEIRWYSLSYIFGILFAWIYSKKILITDKNIRNLFDDLISYLIIGIIIGGRLGYVLFYNLKYYLNNLIEIPMIWLGGMSFHGGLLGILFATIIFSKKHNINKYIFLDLISASAPIGIFLGRISNFINSELYGRETDVFWSVIFTKIDDVSRHPSQIYEAILEGLVLFIVMFLYAKKNYLSKPGLLSALFLIFYSMFRFIAEFYRAPDEQLGFILLNLTMGQIISLIFFSFGFYLFFKKKIKMNNIKNISLDKFIDKALYDKNKGYYMTKNPFEKKGDFITAPNISILFSEMLAIWCIAFWENLGCPKKINIIEMGAGNGEMMYRMIKVFERFDKFYKASNLLIFEKSNFLKKIQRKKITSLKISWIDSIDSLKSGPNIFLANEFFDALPIKQFIKKKNKWFEKKVKPLGKDNFVLIDKPTQINKFEKKIGIDIKKNQKIIEFSPLCFKYLKTISKKINAFQGGLLIIDYGYLEKKMKNTLQSVRKHRFNNILENFSNSDITYSISFYFLKKILKKLNLQITGITTQRKFLTKLGIMHRAEILAKNLKFSQKANIYYRLNRLIDNKFMGNLFKVMFATKKNNKFKLGFEN